MPRTDGSGSSLRCYRTACRIRNKSENILRGFASYAEITLTKEIGMSNRKPRDQRGRHGKNSRELLNSGSQKTTTYEVFRDLFPWNHGFLFTLSVVIPILAMRNVLSRFVPALLKDWAEEPKWIMVSMLNICIVTGLFWIVLRPRPKFVGLATTIGLVVPKPVGWRVVLSFLTLVVVAQGTYFAYLDSAKGGSVLEARELTSNILVPFGEEVAFRGFALLMILESLVGKGKVDNRSSWEPVLLALVLTSAIFSASHGWAPPGFPTLQWFLQHFVVGMILGGLYSWSRSLAVPLSLHMAFNGFISVAILYSHK